MRLVRFHNSWWDESTESVSQWVSAETNDNLRQLETRWEWNCLQPNLTFFLTNINLSRITLTSHSMFNQICMKLQRLTNRPALQAISSFMAGDSCLQSYDVCLPCVPPQDCQGEIQELWGDQDSWTSSWDSWCCACGTWWDCISWSPLSTLYSLSFILLRILDHIWSIVTVLFDLFNPNLLMCYSCNTGMSRNTLQARLIAFKSDN